MKAEDRVYYSALGKHLMSLRQARGMTQKELARELHISQQTVFAYETGARRVSLTTLNQIARVHGLTIVQVLGLNKVRPMRHRRWSPEVLHQAERMVGLSLKQKFFVRRIIDVLKRGE